MKGKESTDNCRVCSGEGVLLDLFGSETQKVSYAEDVNRCLSIKVDQGDGLPTKICVKCVGLLSDCGPFVENILKLKTDKDNNHKSSDGSCYYCSSSSNHLFPIPDKSLHITKELFEIEVPSDVSICHRCQFHLDTIDDLKKKACASLKSFYSRTLSAKEKVLPKKEDTVQEVVGKLTKKFRMEIKEEPSIVNNTYNLKEVKVELVDIALYLSGLPEGTVDLKEYSKRLDRSHRIDVVSNGVKKKPGRKPSKNQSRSSVPEVSQSSQQVGSPLRSKRLSLDDRTKEPSETVLPPKEGDGRKRSREIDSVSDTVPKKSRRNSEREETERTSFTPKVVKKTAKPKSKKSAAVESKKEQVTSEVSEDNTEGISLENATLSKLEETESSTMTDKQQTSVTKSDFSKLSDENGETEKPESSMTSLASPKVIKKVDKPRKTKISSSKEEMQPISVDCVSSTEGGEECSKENDCEKSSPDTLEERPSKPKRKRASGPKSYHSTHSDDEDDPAPPIKRNRKTSEDKDFFGRRSRGSKLPLESPHSDDSGLDESTVSGNEQIADQPDFLKDLDELLKNTPKNTFKPFICSVCHEGYVSTVKGKLHKLIAHDPHSSLVLKLKRCDGEVKQDAYVNGGKGVLARLTVNEDKNDKVNRTFTNTEDRTSTDLDDENDSVNRTSACSADENDSMNRTRTNTETDSNELLFNSKPTERKSAEGTEDEPDDLFVNTKQSKPVSCEKAFDELFGSSTAKEADTATNEKNPENEIKSQCSEKIEDREMELEKQKKPTDRTGEEVEQTSIKVAENVQLTNTDGKEEKKTEKEEERAHEKDKEKTDTDEVKQEEMKIKPKEDQKHNNDEEMYTAGKGEEEKVDETKDLQKCEDKIQNEDKEDSDEVKAQKEDGEQVKAEKKDGEQVEEEVEAEKKDSEQVEAEKEDGEEVEAEKEDGEELEAEKEDGEEVEAEKKDGEEVEAEKEDGEEVEAEKEDGEEVEAEKEDSEEVEAEKENSEEVEAETEVESNPNELTGNVTEANTKIAVNDSEKSSKFGEVPRLLMQEDDVEEGTELSEDCGALPKDTSTEIDETGDEIKSKSIEEESCKSEEKPPNSACDDQLNSSVGDVNVFRQTSDPVPVGGV